MIRSLKAAIWLTALMVLPALAFSSSVLSGLCGLWVTVLAGPVLLMAAGLWGGLAPLLTGLAIFILQPVYPLGWQAAMLAALYLAPFAAVLFLVNVRRTPFFRAAGLLCCAYLAGAFSCLLVLQRLSSGDMYMILARRVADLVTRTEYGDRLLINLYQNGLIRLDPSLLIRAQGLVGGLSVLGRQELTNSLVSALADGFSQAPSGAVTYAVWCCFGGFALMVDLGRRAAQKRRYGDIRKKQLMDAVARQREAIRQGNPSARLELESYESFLDRMTRQDKDAPSDGPDFGMPSFSTWYLPRGLGLLMAVPALGLLMSALGTSVAERTVGAMLGALFTSVYGMQGVAVLDFVQKKTGRSLAGRCVFTVILLFLFRFLFVLMGLIDQVMNIRHLRPEPQE